MKAVLFLCSDAHETCPTFPRGTIPHKGFGDPPRLTENMELGEEKLIVYRRVRDEIRDYVKELEASLL